MNSNAAQEEIRRTFDVSRETMAKLEGYVALLLKWQAKINIIGPSTTEQVWDRHIADSLQLTSIISELRPGDHVSLLDLGTGAGLPGIPLALHLAQEQGVLVHLVDSNSKKAAFLREATRITGIDAKVHCTRIEAIEQKEVTPVPNVVVSRALAPLDQLVAWSQPWIEQGAVGVFQKGRSVEKEIAATDRSRPFDYKVVQSPLNPESSMVVVEARRQGHD